MTRAKPVKRRLAFRGALFSFVAIFASQGPVNFPGFGDASYVYAQSGQKVRSLGCEAVAEEQCPVDVTNTRCDLDVDPFDAPMSARIYIDYKNSSNRPVTAVKFRVRFVDGEGKERGTFHAVHMAYVGPGASGSEKFKRDFTLHPSVAALKIRVLQVKFSDGSDWQSTKMQELAAPPGAAGANQAAPAP